MRQLIATIRSLVAAADPADCDGALCRQALLKLEDAVRASIPRLQTSVICRNPPKPGRYLCYKDPELGFVVMLMAWGQGDGTAIHDHGCWGVEAVLKDALVVTNYTECEKNPQPLESRVCQAGEVIHNTPPDRDVHTVVAKTSGCTLSLHIYGREMSGNRQFIPGEGFKCCGLQTIQLGLEVWDPPTASASADRSASAMAR